MRSVSIAGKIWLSISLLVLGFLLVVGTVFLQGWNSEKRLEIVLNDAIPSARNSIQMLNDFSRQQQFYEEAVLTGEFELLEKGRQSGTNLISHIMQLIQVAEMPKNLHFSAVSLMQEFKELNVTAANVYSNLIVAGDAPTDALQDDAAKLAKRFSEVGEQLEGLNNGVQTYLASHISIIRQVSLKQRYINIAIFFVVLLVSLTTVSRTINRYAVGPLRKLMKTISRSSSSATAQPVSGGDEVSNMVARIQKLFEFEKDMTTRLQKEIAEREEAEAHLEAHKDKLAELVEKRTSALKETNAELQVERDKARQYLDIAGTILVGLDKEGRITLLNKAGCQLVGRRASEVIGLNWFDNFVPKEQKEEMESVFGLLLKENNPGLLIYENEIKTKTGECCMISWHNTLVRDENGKVVGTLSSGEDVTEKRQLEAELLQAQKLESVGQLAAGIAHEINTPAQFVSDNIRFLKESVQDLLDLQEKQAAFVCAALEGTLSKEMINSVDSAIKDIDLEYLAGEIPVAIDQSIEGVERISKIVRAMKEFSQPGSSEITMADLNKLIETTILVTKNQWKSVAEVETDFEPELPKVPCLVGEFNHVILSLIVNACDAISSAVEEGAECQGKINITTCRDGEWVEVRVSDTGPGIPEKIKARIFDPFFSTKDVGRGSGQGLAVSRSTIVDKHKGKLSVESEEGKGATFIIRLPVDP